MSAICGVVSDLRCCFQGSALLQGWLVAFSKRTLLVRASRHDGTAGPFHHTRLWRYRLPDGDFLQHTQEGLKPIGIAANLGYTILQLQGWLVAVLLD